MTYPECVRTSENDKTITLNTIYCNNGTYQVMWLLTTIDKLMFCKINKQRTGQCVKINQYYEPKKLYPGDPCTSNDYTAACAYGLQIC
jgi:hypothetical protein